jgi:hypothetical protein
MSSLTDLLQPSSGADWLLPSALVLGLLHGLEPGHSKTMMHLSSRSGAQWHRRCSWGLRRPSPTLQWFGLWS